MKYVLVDNYDNIITKVDLGSNVGLSGWLRHISKV